MDEINRIAGIIQSIGFQCTRCGTCCSAEEMDSNLVMATPAEIRQIAEFSGIPWQTIAEPYPEKIFVKDGRTFTIGWCIRRDNENCWFLDDAICRIYEKRPWICRTYPFELSQDQVRTFPCSGIGRHISWECAQTIAQALLDRKNAERIDDEKVCSVLRNQTIPSGVFVVIDSEGIKKPPY